MAQNTANLLIKNVYCALIKPKRLTRLDEIPIALLGIHGG